MQTLQSVGRTTAFNTFPGMQSCVGAQLELVHALTPEAARSRSQAAGAVFSKRTGEEKVL